MAKLPPRPDDGLSTDHAWEAWGARDPYYGVLTDPRFRREALTEEARREFFASGERHAAHVLRMIRSQLDADFTPGRVLDFGCGVGRLLLPFSRIASQVVGADVSASMLAEARRNCDKDGAGSVQLVVTDDDLAGVEGRFDLIHSYIVFQHIAPSRGRALLARLLDHLAPRGVAAIQFFYSSVRFAPTLGVEPPPPPPPPLPRVERLKAAWRAPLPPGTALPEPVPAAPIAATPGDDPDMRMYPYNATELLFALQRWGVREMHVELTDHAGELGLFLFFRKP
jgi:SAM-dependent methyltransferase